MHDWITKKLEDVVDLKRGFDLPTHSRRPGPYPVLSSGVTAGWHDEGPIKGPGLVIGRATNLGQPSWSQGDFWPLNTTLYAANFFGNEPRWVFHLFESMDLTGFDSGSVQPMLNRNYIAQLPILVPPIREQRAIAEVLGALDDKIAANTKLVRSLGELFGAHWQALSQTESGNQCRLDSLVADIFAGDWGASDKTATYPEEVFCIRGADLPSLQTSGSGKMPTRFLKSTSLKRRELHVGDIVIEASGGSPTQSTGRAALITDALLSRFNVPLSSSNFCKVLRMKDPKDAFMVYGHLRNSWKRGEFFQYENGTTGIKNLALTNYFTDKEIRLPDDHRLQSFNDLSAEIFKKMQAAGQESDTLAATRDALLPQLMSGKLRVRDIENTMGEMV